MSKYIDLDSECFKWGTYKGEPVLLVAEEDPDYIAFLLGDQNPYKLESEERDLLVLVQEKALEE